ncbi:hypothetical protein ABBQ38_001361 [Trebouxia sp. C0009 RCD-2024]
MSAAAKQHLSQSQKARWRKNPALRAAVSSKLKGKEPWNKGQSMSGETCLRMSEARQGHAVPRRVRVKMSASHTGLTPSKAARAAMSQGSMGVPKAPEHKSKIAAGQRRRHSAVRVLTAVEAFHRGSQLDSPNESGPSRAAPVKPGLLQKQKKSTVQCLSSRNSQPKSMTKSQIMTAYKAELREYRLLQEELGPWTQAFKAQHARKPTLADVERTGIEWLVDKFKSYVILRDRVLSDTSILRDKLHVAVPEASNASSSAGRSTGLKAASYATKLNANAASAKRSHAQSAATFQAALEYRRQQQALAETAAVAAAAADAASQAHALTYAADTAVAAAAAAKTAAGDADLARAADILNPASKAEDAVRAGAGLNGSSRGSLARTLNGLAAQRAQQGHMSANGRHGGSGQTQRGLAAANGSTHGTPAQNGSGQMRGSTQNGNAQLDTTQQDPSSDNGSVDQVVGQVRSGLPQSNGLLPSQTAPSGAAPKKSGRPGTSDKTAAERPASAARSSASEAADNAMTAAVASIHSQQADARPTTPPGGKAIPTPSLNASPRIKSALLAAQEYRKQKAAKTAALAIAAAQAAAKQSTAHDVP